MPNNYKEADDMEFNEKLQELRKARGLTQEELAEVFIVKYKCRKLQTKNVGRCNYIL